MKKVYFPNLNGIRFIAAFLVVIHHIEQLKSLYGLQNHWENKTVQIIGGLGVTLFFVLSGFLITYMLFVEKEHVGTIDVKGFYIRRILRIWPLYFLIVILAFFVIGNFSSLNMPRYSIYLPYEFTNKLLLFIVFLPNAAMLLYPPIPFASQAWSIGVEEQFYLIWPVLIKIFKNTFIILCFIVVFYIAIKSTIYYILEYNVFINFNKQIIFTKNFLELTRINCMAIGGFGAYILYKKNNFLNLFYLKITQLVSYVSVLILIGYGVTIEYLNDEIYSLLFMIIILNLASNKNSIISINNKIFDYFGKISYGLYMYHPLSIVVSIVLSLKFSGVLPFYVSDNIVIYFLSILITICISSFSYEFFEKFFIKKKISFSKVISGENAR